MTFFVPIELSPIPIPVLFGKQGISANDANFQMPKRSALEWKYLSLISWVSQEQIFHEDQLLWRFGATVLNAPFEGVEVIPVKRMVLISPSNMVW